jgi:hypothetical protein
MPNHVTTQIKLKGAKEDIIALRNAIRPDATADGKEDDDVGTIIDFNKIIPMPEELRIESGSSTDNGMAILIFRKTGDSAELTNMLSWPWVKAEGIKDISTLTDYLLKENRANLVTGQQALDNIKKYGHKDWYSWCNDKWGTKWNAYSQTEESIDSFSFNTAWGTPYPIIKKLSEMFPKVKLFVRYADEDFGHNCGELTFQKGIVTEENVPKGGSPKALILATEVKGYDITDLIDMYGSCEDEEFASDIVAVLLSKLSPERVVEVAIANDNYYNTTTLLEALKGELLEKELYELVGRIDTKITEVSNVEEEN